MRSAAGALRLLDRGAARLAPLPEGMGGIALRRLLADVGIARAEIERLAAEGRIDLAPELVPKLTRLAD